MLVKIQQKRASKGRWRPNRKWKYGGDPIFQLSDRYSYSTFYTLWGLSPTVTELVFENVNITVRHVNQRGNFHGGDCHFGEKISRRQTTLNRFILSRNVEKTQNRV